MINVKENEMKRFLLIIFASVLLIAGNVFATVDNTAQTITFNCDGDTVEFDFTFNVGSTDDIKVVLTDASGTATTLTETTDYAVTCTPTNWDAGLNPIEYDCTSGGTVTTVSTYASGYTITITTDIDLTQETEFTEDMPSMYANVEECLDKLTRITKQLDAEIDDLSGSSTATWSTFSVPTTSGDYVAISRPLYAKANQTTSLGQVCFLASDGGYTLAQGDAYATTQGDIAIATASIASGSYGIFLEQGYICNSGWSFSTVGAPVYISSATAGLVTETEPSAGEYVRIIGYVASTTAIKFCPTASPVIKKASK